MSTAKPVRVIVSGCRKWQCQDLADRVVARLRDRYAADLVLVHGGCEGVDRAFEAAAELLGVTREVHPADWEREGKAAGPRRNARMVARGAAFAIAVHRSLAWSKGTRNCVELALAARIPVFLIDNPDGVARRIDRVESPHPVRAASPPEPTSDTDDPE